MIKAVLKSADTELISPNSDIIDFKAINLSLSTKQSSVGKLSITFGHGISPVALLSIP